MREKPRPQTVHWGDYNKMNRRVWFSMMIGFALGAPSAIMLTDGLPIEQRLLWIAGAVVVFTLAFVWLFVNSSGEPWTATALLAAETDLVEVVGDPSVIIAVWKAPDIEQQLGAIQGLSSLTVPPAALIAVGPLGIAVGPSKPQGEVTQFIERKRVDDIRDVTAESIWEWPRIAVDLRSRRAAPVTVEFVAASRRPFRRWGNPSLRPPQADEREVRQLVAAMRSALGLSVA